MKENLSKLVDSLGVGYACFSIGKDDLGYFIGEYLEGNRAFESMIKGEYAFSSPVFVSGRLNQLLDILVLSVKEVVYQNFPLFLTMGLEAFKEEITGAVKVFSNKEVRWRCWPLDIDILAIETILYDEDNVMEDAYQRDGADEQVNDLAGMYLMFKEVFHQLPYGAVLYDKEGTIVDVNPLFELGVGVTKEKLRTLNIFERIVDEGILEAVERSLEGKPGYYEGIYHAVMSSNKMPVRGVFLGLRSKNKEIIGGVGVLENITKRIRAEKASLEVEINFKQFLERSNDLFYRQNFHTGFFEYISPSLNRILGYESSFFYETSPEEQISLFHPEELPGLLRFREDLLLADEEGVILEREFRFRHQDGVYRWLLGRYTLLRNEGGDPMTIIGILQETTQRKRAEEDLLQREVLLKSLINNAPFDVWVRDVNGLGVYENQKAIDHFGSIVGKYVMADDTIPDETIEVWKSNNRRILNGEVINEESSFIINNEWHTYQQIAFPIMNGGSVEGIAGFNIDITERIKFFSRVGKLNDCLLAFGNDTHANISELLKLCGEVLKCSIAIYNRINDRGEVTVAAEWGLPDKFVKQGRLEDLICCSVMKDPGVKPIEINCLQESIYNRPGTNVSQFGYQTYLGVGVRVAGKTLGSLCLFYKDNLTLPKQDSDFLVLVSYAVGIEEERATKEQSLKTTLERNKALLEAIPDEMYLFNREGYVLHRPGSIEFAYESSVAHLDEFDHVSGLFSEEISEVFIRSISKVLDSGVAEFCTLEIPDIPEIRVYETRFVKCGEDEVLAIMRDITEQRRAEMVSRESEFKYKLLADNARDVIWTMDLTGKYHYVSPSVFFLRGLTPEENMQETLDDCLTPESAVLAKQMLMDYSQVILAGAQPEPVLLALEQYHKNGGTVWTEINISAIYDELGSFKFFLGVTRDITERVKSERLIEESRAKLEAILKTLPDLLFVMDSEGNYLDVIVESSDRLAFPKEEIIGKNVYELFSKNFAGLVMDHVRKCFETRDLVKFSYSMDGDETNSHYEARLIYAGENTVLTIVRDVTREVEATASLKESEERYRGLQELFRNMADNMMDMLWAKDLSGKFLFVNKSICERLLGVSDVNEPIGKDESCSSNLSIIDDNFGEAHRNQCAISDNLVLETGNTLRLEEVHQVNGKDLWLEVDKSPLRNKEGQIIGTVGAARDITERKLMEKKQRMQQSIGLAISESESFAEFIQLVCDELSAFIDMSNFYVALYDFDQNVFESPVFSDLYDSTDKWPASNSLSEIVIRKNAPVLLNFKEITELKESGRYNYLGPSPKSWFGIPLRKEGIPFGVFALQNYEIEDAYVDTDLELMLFVSNQIGVAVNRKEDEQQIKLLFKSIEQSSVSVVITDNNGTIEYVNPKFTDVAGYSLEEAIGQNPRILKSGNQSDSVYKELWENISKGNQWSGEFLNKTKGGELYWEFARISPVFNTEGVITNYVAIKEDITERKRLFEELVKAKELAQESDRLKSAFLANMSHEIRTPLNGILGFADLLGEGNLSNNEVVEYASIISKSGSRLLELINNLIDISKIESGTVKVSLKPMIPFQLLEDVMNQFLIRAQRQGIDLRVAVPDSLLEESILSDSVKIHQVLTNLINNALKFTDKGTIEAGFVFDDEAIEFFVKDTGRGIPKELHDKVFDRFYQVDTAYSRGFEGAGLGLSLCKGLVDLLQGKIWVESEPGQGSTFKFTVPLRRSLSAQNTIRNAQDTRGALRGPKVLVAEDDEDSFNYIKILLKRWGFEVIRAQTGMEVVRLVEKDNTIRVVLMDIKMPHLDGLEATRLIRSFNKRVFIVAQTGFAVSGDRERCLNAGCNEYISKPVAKEILEEVLRPYMLS